MEIMKKEINENQLIELGFKANQRIRWEEGRIGINNVIGFTNESKEIPSRLMPARFLAGFLPTFLLAEQIQVQTRTTPTVRIFLPKHIAERVNGIAENRLNAQIELSKKLVWALQNICFPNTHLVFTEDKPLTPFAVSILEKFFNLIIDSETREVIESIHKSAQKHGDQQGTANANIYIAHHPVGWQEVEAKEIFAEKLPDVVINTLPPSEKRFLSLRRSIRERVRKSRAWKTPREIHDIEMSVAGAHYLLLNPSEPTLEDALCLPGNEIIDRLMALKKQSKNDNIRKAKNDFERLMNIIAIRSGETVEEVSKKSLGELLKVTI